ncbi:MAG: platelet-activating factor acetylhydrolase IB subunit [Planctomycetia bacterium]|nr:platelet-activating factor acetylhydrolase IB subunit [Planctomycetia bacterium]
MRRNLSFVGAILSCVFVCNLVVAQNIATTPTEKKDGWWQTRHAQKCEQAAKGDVDIVFLGDSITHFWEGNGKSVFDKYYKDYNVLNLGFSADRTEHVLWRLNNGEIDGIAPKMLVLMIGTNNVGHGSTNPAQTIEGIQAILETLGEKLPNTKVLLLAVFPRSEKPTDALRVKVEEINAGLPALCDNERVFFLNFNDQFLTKEGILTREIMPDLLHPGAAGYEIWANAIQPYVEKWVSDAK